MKTIDECIKQEVLCREIRWGELFEQNGERYLKIQTTSGYNAINMETYTTEWIELESYVVPLETTLTITKRGK